MRILIISDAFPSIGQPYFGLKRYELAKGLILIGHKVLVLAPGKVKTPTLSNFKGVQKISIPACFCLNKFGIYYPLPNLSVLFSIIKKVGKEFDIHHYYKQEYLTSLPSISNTSAAKILTVDNFPGLDYTHGDKLIDFVTRIHSLATVRFMLSKFDGIISLSTISGKTAIRFGAAKERVRYIPHGIYIQNIHNNPEFDEKIKKSLGITGPIFAFVGRLSSVKGIKYLIQSIEILERKRIKADFLVVGDGPEKKYLSRISNKGNIRVHFLGYRCNPLDFICASDFLVLPSLSEGCPSVVLEAFALGKPVVGTRVGGTPDLIYNYKTGIVVPSMDPQALAKAIEFLVTHNRECDKMGKDARKYAETNLDWKNVIPRISNFYCDIRDNLPL